MATRKLLDRKQRKIEAGQAVKYHSSVHGKTMHGRVGDERPVGQMVSVWLANDPFPSLVHRTTLEVEISRECYRCHNSKPIDEFINDRSRTHGKGYMCKECAVSYLKESDRKYKSDPDNRKKISAATQRRHDLIKYDITPEKYEALLKQQKGKCAICRQPETAKLRGKTRRLCVDHIHGTTFVRGLLCLRCNRAIGCLLDNLDASERMPSYLRGQLPEQRQARMPSLVPADRLEVLDQPDKSVIQQTSKAESANNKGQTKVATKTKKAVEKLKKVPRGQTKHDKGEPTPLQKAKAKSKVKAKPQAEAPKSKPAKKAAPVKAEKAKTTKKVAPKAETKVAKRTIKPAATAANGNPFRDGSNSWLITEALLKGGSRSKMIDKLLKKIDFNPTKKKINKKFNHRFEMDKRVLMTAHMLRKDHGFTIELSGRGPESGTIKATPPSPKTNKPKPAAGKAKTTKKVKKAA